MGLFFGVGRPIKGLAKVQRCPCRFREERTPRRGRRCGNPAPQAASRLHNLCNGSEVNGARPAKGSNKAIAEWPTASGPADYALFAGQQLVGFVEAKKKAKDVVSDLGQARRYSRDVQIVGEESFVGGPWGEYKVPFLFSTNSRPYLEQLKDKSGVWFVDARQRTNHPRPLQGWYSPDELLGLLGQNTNAASRRLLGEPKDYLGLRDYQETAVEKIEAAIDRGQREILLAMATGTGKTRVAIGLVYRLIKSERFRRVLFLVDRNTLGEQAEDKFKETRLEELHTFDQIYDLKGVNHVGLEATTRLHISTVQGMMHRILYSAEEDQTPSVGMYDCIIVDEAHRGYTLDRELGETELLYRDQNDYISKFRRVIEYFDAVKIGLTATPAPQTVEIFGKPVFTYGYRDAVVDGWLVDHDPPHQIETKLKQEGIKWKQGDTVPVYDPATGEVTNLEDIPDEIELEVDHFNRLVLTENFNRTVAKELVKCLNPDGDGKTLVFADTDDHADTVVRILFEEFANIGVELDDSAIRKITGSIDHPQQMIRRYKNERLPNIAVTVDLLTTGIDVPEICNLVFIRRVRSRILFEQMLGRATRRCDEIGKDHFSIYDTVGLYEALEPVSSMKAVSPNPSVTLEELADEFDEMLGDAVDPAQLKRQMEQILAKLQRVLRRLEGDDLEQLRTLAGGQSLQQLIDSLDPADPAGFRRQLSQRRGVLSFLDENRARANKQLISHHEDELRSHTRGYGNAEKPEDYLSAFKSFIIDNLNRIPALAIVCQRPRELTRQSLRELKMALDQAGYTEHSLRTAWQEWTNEDIAADLISFVRRQALGDPLVSHDDRIRAAMQRVLGLQDWTAIQRQWLERIEKHLLKETVLDREDFDKGAFRAQGGFRRLDKIFQGNFAGVLQEINDELYRQETA
ncbi:MAG: type I restriction-modification system endonuclease [Lentisphaeria bacterium]|nr:type I restriction-modification system endonuclease [Lentisphaeria bacterium]